MKEPEPRPKLVRDPEVQAMDRIGRLLKQLPVDARGRVLRWLIDRYAPSPQPHEDPGPDISGGPY